MNSKKLTYTCLGFDTELSSLCEGETTCIKQNAYTHELTPVIIKEQGEK